MPAPDRRGSILLFMLGLLTVMLVVAFAFVTTMQMARETAKQPRRQMLARLAAEMGVQHAIAVCQHGYTMANERRDNLTVPAVSRYDSPHKNVFNILSPRRGDRITGQQPPLPWDLSPDVPFQDLLGGFSGTYHQWGINSTIMRVFSDGWTMDRGYARLIEANRFDVRIGTLYDPATYDDYDLSPLSATPQTYPNAATVGTPFPPVDPFVTGKAIVGRHDLDHPLWLDADYRPVAGLDDPAKGAVRARYRLRYAVYVQDMSLAMWLNTDPAWLTGTQKAQMRTAYAEPVAAVGAMLGRKTSVPLDYGVGMESVFRGYGQYGNSRFDPAQPGIPLDWTARGGQPMYYRGPLTAFSYSPIQRAVHNVHGSPFMDWFDPDPSNPAARTWIGSALTSWNDLAFAIQDHTTGWQENGETDTVTGNHRWGVIPVRGEPFAQRIATPFGRPYAAATDNPWAVNLLVAPMKVIESMVAAYVPPVARSTWSTKMPLDPGGPRVYVDGPAPGPGADLFTDGFRPAGRQPFANHTTPANRDYWTSAASARPNHVGPADARPATERYPGAGFFTDPVKECGGGANGTAPAGQVWSSITATPRQVADDPAFHGMGYDPWPLYQSVVGADHLARHIVFYDHNATATVGSNKGFYSSHFILYSQNRELSPTKKVCPVTMPQSFLCNPLFTPMTPFGCDLANLMGEYDFNVGSGQPSNTKSPLGIGLGGGAFNLIRNHNNGVGRGDSIHGAPNSYWIRAAYAFAHAAIVGQIANLAWADPQDARSTSFWPTYSASGWANVSTPAGIIYTKTPAVAVTKAMRKGPTTQWDPQAAHFANEEMIDRQFLANLGESFDQPGLLTPAQALAEADASTGVPRPPRFSKCQTDYWDGSKTQAKTNHIYAAPSSSSFAYGSFLVVGEYRVTNNIRTLLLPSDASFVASADPTRLGTCNPGLPVRGVATIANPPPRGLWLLDEWNAAGEAGYKPAEAKEVDRITGAGPFAPTAVARTRAKLMERVLNDWRMSFLGAARGYAAAFRPKDFDGDGIVFCSGYLDATGGTDTDTTLTCWQTADAAGNGPGIGQQPGDPASGVASLKLTLFSVTGCMAFQRSHQYKIQVRGELFDNVLDRAVGEQYLETALLVDPDNDVVRGPGLPTGLTDSTVIMQRPVHNYYKGYLAGSYP